MSYAQCGDRVRVTIEGKVTNVWPDGLQIEGIFYPTPDYMKPTIEVVEKAKPKVGDIIDRRRDLSKLPTNSVVVNKYNETMLVADGQTFGRLTASCPIRSGQNNAPYRVVYLPDAA